MNVELSDEAREQVLKIDAWWRTNRPAAPDLFTNELALALTKLEGSPSLGTSYDAGSKTVRDTLFVIAVWSAFRGVGPTL